MQRAMKRSARFLALRTTAWRSIAPIAALLPTPCSGSIEPLRNWREFRGLSVVTPRLQTKRSFVVPAQAGIQVRFSGSSKVLDSGIRRNDGRENCRPKSTPITLDS